MTSGRRGTASFFLLAFALTWMLQIPGVLAQRGLLPGDPAHYLPLAGLGLLGPLAAAVFLTVRERGWAAVRELGAPLLRYRVHVGWYLAALVLPAGLLSLVLWLLNAAGRHGPIAYLPSGGALLFGVVVSVVEEVGWRGYALPRLMERYGAFAASVVLGIAWYLWHLPMFAAQGVPPNLVLVMLLYFVGASLFMTWIFEGSGRSLLLMVVAHLGAHANNSHRALPTEVLPLVVHAVVYASLGWLVMRKAVSDRRARPLGLERSFRGGRAVLEGRSRAPGRGLG